MSPYYMFDNSIDNHASIYIDIFLRGWWHYWLILLKGKCFKNYVTWNICRYWRSWKCRGQCLLHCFCGDFHIMDIINVIHMSQYSLMNKISVMKEIGKHLPILSIYVWYYIAYSKNESRLGKGLIKDISHNF